MNAVDSKKDTALHWMSRAGRLDLLEVLLKDGLSIGVFRGFWKHLESLVLIRGFDVEALNQGHLWLILFEGL